jgi:hypothetical protein
MRFALSGFVVFTPLVLSASAGAQSPMYSFYGGAAGDQFGRSLALQTVQGQKHLIVGAPFADAASQNVGEIVRFNALDGSRVPGTSFGVAPNEQYGSALCASFDHEGNGQKDLAVGAPIVVQGRIRVFASSVFDVYGTQHGESFGNAIANAGDVDGDGKDDLLVGSFRYDDGVKGNAGRAQVISSLNGASLYQCVGDSSQDQMGFAVASIGDVNGDQIRDFAVGANKDDNGLSNRGMVRVYSGANGATLFSKNGDGATDEFGFALAAPGDIDGDGIPDLLVGAPFSDQVNGVDCGYARVISGANGANIFTWRGAAGDQMGYAVAAGGDWNGDGRQELVVAAPLADASGPDTGLVRVFSGTDGTQIAQFDGKDPGEGFAQSVHVGFVDGDLVPDLLVGAPLSDVHGLDAGAAYVFSGYCPHWGLYCTAKVNSLGCLPTLVIDNTPCDATFPITARGVRNQKNGLLFYGVSGRTAIPFQGGTLCVSLPIRRTPVVDSGGTPNPFDDCTGVYSLDMKAFATGALGGSPIPELLVPGTLVQCQWWGRDPGFAPPNDTSLSNAIEYEVQ